MKNYKASTTTKSTTTRFSQNVGMALLIFAASFLPYIHDIDIFGINLREIEGFQGFKSLRSAFFVLGLMLFGMIGWIFAFIKSKGELYRIAFLVPICMVFYQLLIYLLDIRKTSTNDFSTKVLVNILIMASLMATYLFIKYKRSKNEKESN